MIRAIQTSGRVNASVAVPGSKSITNRALVCAALAHGTSQIRNASDSDDTHRLVNGLNQFGVLVRRAGGILHIDGTGGRLFAPRYPIPVGNAGTTFRFLCSVAALAQGRTEFHLDPRMAERPMEDLLEALGLLGAVVEGGRDASRVAVTGGRLHGGVISLRTTKSSQFLSSLLLASPCIGEEFCVRPEGAMSSRPYVDMTLAVMSRFGVNVGRERGGGYRVEPGMHYRPADFTSECDVSGASYFFAAAAISGGVVTVPGVRRSSLQGDIGILDLLGRMGCDVQESSDGLRVRRDGPLYGIDVDMNGMPDMVPTLAVAALFAKGESRIRNVAHLRYKESDRLHAVATELQKTGANVTLHADGIAIRPGDLHGAQLDTHDDHRLAMSFALIGLAVPGIAVENPHCVRKSFPGFWGEFEKLERRG